MKGDFRRCSGWKLMGCNWKVHDVLAWAFRGMRKWLAFQSSAVHKFRRLSVQYLTLTEKAKRNEMREWISPGSR